MRTRIDSGLSSSRCTSGEPQWSQMPSTLRLARIYMIDSLAIAAGAATAQALHDLVQRQIVAQDRIKIYPFALEKCIKFLGLSHRARKAVEQESASTAQAADPFLDHGNDHAIGDQFTPPHRLQSRIQRRARAFRATGPIGRDRPWTGDMCPANRRAAPPACPCRHQGDPAKPVEKAVHEGEGGIWHWASPPLNHVVRSPCILGFLRLI